MDDRSDHEYAREVDRVINLYNHCKDFHVLPRSGGVYDQDSMTMYLLSVVREAVNERASKDSQKQKIPSRRGRGGVR